MSKHYMPSAVLKDNAKGFLNGKYRSAIGATLVYIVLSNLLMNAISMLSDGIKSLFVRSGSTSFTAVIVVYILSYCLSGLGVVITGIILVGMSYYYLKMGTGHLPRVSDIFYGFREDAGKSFKASLGVAAPAFISYAPSFFIYVFYNSSKSRTLLFAFIIATVIGSICYIFFDISLKMTFYILVDFPELSASEALKSSWEKMSGHRMRLFLLEISFIPYIILSLLSLGVGLLWVYPYIQESIAQFYLDLMNPKTVTGEWERTV